MIGCAVLMIQFAKHSHDAGIDLIMIDIPKNVARIFDVSKMKSFFETMTNDEFEGRYLN